MRSHVGSSPSPIIAELSRQLESWRLALPASIKWLEEETLHPSSFATRNEDGSQSVDSKEQDISEFGARAQELMVATLRSRFYYARFMVHRPAIYKAMHSPQLMTNVDAGHCAIAMNSACMWPLLCGLSEGTKRLVPHLFTWTQNFVSILVILATVRENETMRRICETSVDLSRVRTTTLLMASWLRDMASLDGTAEWAVNALPGLFESG